MSSGTEFPDEFVAGETIRWRHAASVNHIGDPVTNADYALTYYLRSNRDGQAQTITGTTYGTGWEFVLSANATSGMDAGSWQFMAIASKSDDTVTLASGRFVVKESLAYTGLAGAYDPRTDTEKELDLFVAAIQALGTDKAQSYTIGTRTFTRIDLADLIQRESQLRARLKREQRSSLKAQGLGDPNRLHVRF